MVLWQLLRLQVGCCMNTEASPLWVTLARPGIKNNTAFYLRTSLRAVTCHVPVIWNVRLEETSIIVIFLGGK